MRLVVDRHLDCDGVFNLRDLGGYPTVDGRSVRWRTVFRGDGLHRAHDPLGPVRATSCRTVIDLRTVGERTAGFVLCDDVESLHLPLLLETWDRQALALGSPDPVDFLVERYLEMAENGGGGIASILETLARPTRLPAVFHCSAGKDRTGVVAALLLATLGVEDRHIADDYHLSARAIDRIVASYDVPVAGDAVAMVAVPPAFLACPPEAILGFLDRLRERHGSTDGYLASIGIGGPTLAALRDALLE